VLDQRVCSMLVYYSQASLTVPVYACLFLFMITHESVLSILISNFIYKYSVTHARPKHALHAPSILKLCS